MLGTIFDFIRHSKDGSVTPEAFYLGIHNLHNEILALSSPVLVQQLLEIPLRDDGPDQSRWTAAVCFQNIGKILCHDPSLASTAFHYNVVSEGNAHVVDSILFSALQGLRSLLEDSEPLSGPEADKLDGSRSETLNDMAVGAYFSARSRRCLEPLGNIPIQYPTLYQAARNGEVDWTAMTNLQQHLASGNRSLGQIIERFGYINYDCFRSDSFGYKRALATWFFMLSGNNFDRLRPHLSSDQLAAAYLLLEWWDGYIDFKRYSRRSRVALLQSAVTGVSPTSYAKSPYYQDTMLSLFDFEFLPHLHGADGLRFRPSCRRLAARIAGAQRLAMTVCKPLLAQHSITSRDLEYEYVQRGRTESTQFEGYQNLGASISPCDWLQATEAENDLPYYLWDIEQERTVVVHTLTTKVEYAAISHTWGRWRKHDCPSVRIKGVNDWLVPQNTRFSVTDLPTILSSASLGTPFVWFDLLCIPQDTSDHQLKQIARDEIGRQARIFRGAKFAAAWLNDVDEWEGLHVALRQISTQFLRTDYCLPLRLLDFATGKAEKREVQMELFRPPTTEPQTIQSEVFDGEINGWFSSLWTLQEVCLRPDMRLCDRQWNVFAVGWSRETPVRIDSLVTLMEENKEDREPYIRSSLASPVNNIRQHCKSTSALADLCRLSGLAALPNSSRSTILTLGNHRYCEQNRAEAIMSAIGVTEWYTRSLHGESEGITSPPTPEQKQQQPASSSSSSSSSSSTIAAAHEYPFPFLQEAARKIGGEFYASTFLPGELIGFLTPCDPFPPASSDNHHRKLGTLLPFSPLPIGRSRSIADGLFALEHPSVQTWTLQPDHSVHISQASIISYTGQRRLKNPDCKRGILVDMRAPGLNQRVSLRGRTSIDVDLDDWVDSYLPPTRNFAVCLHYGPPTDGVLLKETVSGDLVKVGVFILQDSHPHVDPLATTYHVDWRVL
ncbi:hypothetical protein HFD88_009224 [Aspergillus terreus]|nr:hypothetical protein HFD88_009224 [Aspergillus terreus]